MKKTLITSLLIISMCMLLFVSCGEGLKNQITADDKQDRPATTTAVDDGGIPTGTKPIPEETLPATDDDPEGPDNAGEELEIVIENGHAVVNGIGSCSDTEIVIPSEYNGYPVTEIGREAFLDLGSITGFEIPDGITNIGYRAFSGTAYYNNEGNRENGVLYNGRYLIAAAPDKISEKYTVKDGTALIACGAFCDCGSLTSIEIPESVTGIGEDAFSGSSLAIIYGKPGSYAETYAKNNGYQFSDGKSGWQQIGDDMYYFDENGIALTGWLETEGSWYYLGENGIMLTGWQQIDDQWYYLGTDGIMVSGWQTISGTTYYFYGGGIMSTDHWEKADDGWYYLKSNGAMAQSETLTVNDRTYTFDENGLCLDP